MLRVLVATYLLCFAAADADVAKPEERTAEAANKFTNHLQKTKSDDKETTTQDDDLDDIDMNMLLEKMNDDTFLDKVVEKMVDKLFAKDTDAPAIDFSQYLDDPKYKQAAEDFNNLVEEYAKQYDTLSKMSDEEYDQFLQEKIAEQKQLAQNDDEDEAEQDDQNDEEDENEEDAENEQDEDTQEDQDDAKSQLFLAQQDDQENPLFKLCDAYTLTMSSLAGVAAALVVTFIKAKFEKPGVDIHHPMLG